MSKCEQPQQQFHGEPIAKPGHKPNYRNAHMKAYIRGYWRCGGCGVYLHPELDKDKIMWGKGKGKAKYRYHKRCTSTAKSARLRYNGRGAISRKERSLIVKRY